MSFKGLRKTLSYLFFKKIFLKVKKSLDIKPKIHYNNKHKEKRNRKDDRDSFNFIPNFILWICLICSFLKQRTGLWFCCCGVTDHFSSHI